MDSQLPFLCGDTEECRTMGHPKAVNMTISNIEANYLVVGVLEMLEETIVVLECLMPDMMNGLGELYAHSNIHKKVICSNSFAIDTVAKYFKIPAIKDKHWIGEF